VKARRATRQRGVAGSTMLLVLLAVLIGLAAGIGGYTLVYSEAFSYMSSDSKVCANCHIMNSQYDSWQKASHHAVAGCVDCHLPQDFIGKWTAKALNGYHHSKGFTLQDFHEPIMIKPGNSSVLQKNCVTCHQDIVDGINTHPGNPKKMLNCVHCHREVGHGPVR